MGEAYTPILLNDQPGPRLRLRTHVRPSHSLGHEFEHGEWVRCPIAVGRSIRT